MTLLFITQKIHGQDAFGALWAEKFIAAGFDVHVLCLESRPQEALQILGRTETFRFQLSSLGKENGASKFSQLFTFFKLITTLKYDRVFIHMAPVWGMLGSWYWVPKRMPVYLWYTHYKMQLGLWMLGFYAKRMFAATPQSLPQYDNSPKKVVTGHGIDLSFWPMRANVTENPKKLLCVHRLSRSKRLELILKAMTLLPEYTLDIYGIDAEKDYAEEMRALTQTLDLSSRVQFHGTIAMKELPQLYTTHRLILNMASETIDKTMLEAMTCGCYPVTTKRNAEAIGIPAAPSEDTPEAIAEFVLKYTTQSPLSPEELYAIVTKRHSLEALIEKMSSYIRLGQ